MPARRILQLGDPALRLVSSPVDIDPTGALADARLVLRDLRATLHEFQRTHGFGRGISAIQIGEPLRMIYLEFEGAPHSLLNPIYERQSPGKFTLWDDCFSFPNLMVKMERSASVAVRYADADGNRHLLEASDALSELLQHEMDHLDGILAVDRALDRDSFCTRDEYLVRFAGSRQKLE